MKYSVRIQEVYSGTLEETKNELVVVRGLYEEVYVGALFFKLDAYECLKPNIIYQKTIEDASATDIVLAAYEMLKEHNMLKRGTLKTMAHWQSVNGLTDDFMIESYRYKTDEEYYNFLKKGEN